VALVLAIDVCGSIDDNRFKRQREGITAAERLFATQPLIAAAKLSTFRVTAGRTRRFVDGGRKGCRSVAWADNLR
jgi:hypothetical protein